VTLVAEQAEILEVKRNSPERFDKVPAKVIHYHDSLRISATSLRQSESLKTEPESKGITISMRRSGNVENTSEARISARLTSRENQINE
jgi:hypothetical protein